MDLSQTATRSRIEELLDDRDDYQEIRERMATLRAEVSDLEDRRDALQAEAESADSQAEHLAVEAELGGADVGDVDGAEETAEQARQEASDAQTTIRRKRKAIGRLEEKAEAIREDALEAERDRRVQKYRTAVEELAEAAQRLQEANERVAEMESTLFRSIAVEPPHEPVAWDNVLAENPTGALSRSDARVSDWLGRLDGFGYDVDT